MLKKGLFSKSTGIDGATPLHRAAEIGSISCAKILLEFDADINATNHAKETPFHIAALNRQIEFGNFLLENNNFQIELAQQTYLHDRLLDSPKTYQ